MVQANEVRSDQAHAHSHGIATGIVKASAIILDNRGSLRCAHGTLAYEIAHRLKSYRATALGWSKWLFAVADQSVMRALGRRRIEPARHKGMFWYAKRLAINPKRFSPGHGGGRVGIAVPRGRTDRTEYRLRLIGNLEQAED